MNSIRHGLTIGIERTGERFFLSLRAIGKLTPSDYEHITPVIDAALTGVTADSVDVFIDASDFDGWELRAAWDDFRIALSHGREFRKVAIYGNKRWQEIAANVGNWMISGEARHFDDAAAALAWLAE